MIHLDTWEPPKVKNLNGTRYFITSIDYHTRTGWLFLCKEKTNFPNIVRTLFSSIVTQFRIQIKMIRSDNRTKFFNSVLTYFSQNNIWFIDHVSVSPTKWSDREKESAFEWLWCIIVQNHVHKIFGVKQPSLQLT